MEWLNFIFVVQLSHCLEISIGLGLTVGKVICIGLMGYNATLEKVHLTLKVLHL
jgi:aspartate aminotransferase-like enzyme